MKSQFKYATVLTEATGVSRYLIVAARDYQRAGDQGHGESQFRYADMAEHGEGISRDLVVAAKYYRPVEHNNS